MWRYGVVWVWYWAVRGGSNFPGVVLTWPPEKNDKSGSNIPPGLAPEVLALGGSNLPSGSANPKDHCNYNLTTSARGKPEPKAVEEKLAAISPTQKAASAFS